MPLYIIHEGELDKWPDNKRETIHIITLTKQNHPKAIM